MKLILLLGAFIAILIGFAVPLRGIETDYLEVVVQAKVDGFPQLPPGNALDQHIVDFRQKWGSKLGDITFDEIAALLAHLRNEVEKLKPALLIIDPLVAALGAKVDMYRANEVRPFMERLGALARETKTAVLVIHHTNKGSGQRAAYRASGSLDFTAAARVTMAVDIVEPESGLRAVVVAKSNYGPTNVGLNFSLADDKFEWLGPSNVTAEELLSRPHSSTGSPALDDAGEFLKDKLKHGAVSQREIVSEAEQVGIALTTLKRAKTKLGIKSRRISSDEVTGAGHWEWYFPEQEGQGDQGGQGSAVETLDPLDSEQVQEVDTSGTVNLSYFQDRGDGLIEPSQQQFDGLGVTYDGMGH